MRISDVKGPRYEKHVHQAPWSLLSAGFVDLSAFRFRLPVPPKTWEMYMPRGSGQGSSDQSCVLIKAT